MKEKLIAFLQNFDELSEDQIHELARLMTVVEIKKNEVIVREGQICNVCYFVLKGCLRQYILQDGIEKTIAIYTEEQAINFYANQKDTKKSESFLVSLEDSLLLTGNPDTDEAIYSKFPVLAEITRNMLEADLGQTQLTLAKFISSSPEERYLNLLNDRPELFQRVPLAVIASYLGMTPESLSRIRKRIHAKKH